jgi:hypothetical protein
MVRTDRLHPYAFFWSLNLGLMLSDILLKVCEREGMRLRARRYEKGRDGWMDGGREGERRRSKETAVCC